MPTGNNQPNKLTIEYIKNELKSIQPDVELLTTDYVNNKQKLKFRCSCGKMFEKSWSTIQHRKSCQCRTCTYKRTWDNGERKGFDFKENYIQEFKQCGFTPQEIPTLTKEKILCSDKEGYLGFISLENVRLNKTFSRFSIIFNEENFLYNLNHFAKLNNIKTVVVGYKKEKPSTSIKLQCVCECGNIFTANLGTFTTQHQWRCPKCSHIKSFLECKVEEYLQELNVDYVWQKIFDDCINPKTNYRLRFDYYLPKYNSCIEVDGQQHFKSVIFDIYNKNEQQNSLEYRQYLDEIKNNYCSNHHINLIRISYKDIQKNSTKYKELLNNLFNQS